MPESRPEDIEPNLDFELDRFAEKDGSERDFSEEARTRFLSFALSPTAAGAGNFRDVCSALHSFLRQGANYSVPLARESTTRRRSILVPAQEGR